MAKGKRGLGSKKGYIGAGGHKVPGGSKTKRGMPKGFASNRSK